MDLHCFTYENSTSFHHLRNINIIIIHRYYFLLGHYLGGQTPFYQLFPNDQSYHFQHHE